MKGEYRYFGFRAGPNTGTPNFGTVTVGLNYHR